MKTYTYACIALILSVTLISCSTSISKDNTSRPKQTAHDRAVSLFMSLNLAEEEPLARKIINALYKMVENVENDSYEGVACLAFTPNYPTESTDFTISQHLHGCEYVRSTFPRLINLMRSGQAKEIDAILRAVVHDKAPIKKDWNSWNEWQSEIGEKIFSVPSPCWPREQVKIHDDC